MQNPDTGDIGIFYAPGPAGFTKLPVYKCHKTVWALKIVHVERRRLKPDEEDDGMVLLVPEDVTFTPFWVDAAYRQRHDPKPGGYFVIYADGYKSFSPAKAFEDGYTRAR